MKYLLQDKREERKMIKLISHRGNLNGQEPQYENTILKIDHVLSKGYDVEIDVWKLPDEDCFGLGHDKPISNQSVPLWFLENPKLWVHCKNQEAWQLLVQNPYEELMKDYQEPIYTWFVNHSNKKFWNFDGLNYGICSDFIESYSGIND